MDLLRTNPFERGDLPPAGADAAACSGNRWEFKSNAILHATTHQLVSVDNPATVGEALEIYLTGLIDGAVIPPQVIVEGHLATGCISAKLQASTA